MKYDINKVRELFDECGYKLITTEYKNNTQKLEFVCDKGHKETISLKSFLRGRRCNTCGYQKTGDKLKISFDKIVRFLESKNFTVLSTENNYNNSKDRIEVLCENGHRTSVLYHDVKRGIGCKYCGYDRTAQSISLDIDFIKNEFEACGYTLLTKTYKNSRQKLKFVCDKGHTGSMTYTSFQSGNRCIKCGYESSSEKRKQDINYITNFIKEQVYELV
jgi:hypothetical protein